MSKEDSTEEKPEVYCSFCGLSNKDEDVEKIVAGQSVAICNRCIVYCVSTLIVPNKKLTFGDMVGAKIQEKNG